jgi:uncharacterized protein (TIGR02145 family)
MKKPLSRIFVTVLAFAAVFFLCCTDVPSLEFPAWEGIASSSSLEQSSSSSEVESSSSVQSSSSMAISSSSELGNSSSNAESLSSAHSSSSAATSSSSVSDVCGDITFNTSNWFCYDGNLYKKCANIAYDPTTQTCIDNELILTENVCGDVIFDYAGSEFCYEGTFYNKCDNMPYNPTTQICNGDGLVVPAKCGSEAYNPLTHGCCGNAIFPKATQFCVGTTPYEKCGGTEEYTPSMESCCGSKKYASATHLCDTRDSNAYKYVSIGTQTWMAENLNYVASGSKCGSVLSGDGNLNDNNTATCDIYGRLYDWSTATAVCPQGWHIPSDAEWTTLTDLAGGALTSAGTKLKANSALWSINTGTDDYGFSALPGGYGEVSYNTKFTSVGDIGFWWSATGGSMTGNNASNSAYVRYIYSSYAEVTRNSFGRSQFLSVRCVKN